MGAGRANFVEKIILASLFATLLFLTSDSQLLPEDEVQALQTISTKLQNIYWPYLNRSSCNGGFNQTILADKVYSGVECNCTFNSSTVCHVIRIQMKRLNLSGTLPEEFVNLTHLLEIDLTLNYLNGSIPTAFGQLRVITLSLVGNRISGRIPAEIGEISTLEELLLDDNLLEGNLPENLGSLSSLKRLMLSANNFSGTIPETFSNLRNLTDFRIDGSKLSGKIPEFIGNWTQLQYLDMQGTSMEGPIPAVVSQLRNLTHLRLSDVKGPPMSFPDLQNLKVMMYLILRNCSLTGRIPPYLGDMATLDTLDLSFNTFNGEIPARLQEMKKLEFMFLSHNMLTGAIPDWILSSRQYMDVSYNNFTQSSVSSCAQFSTVNLVASHSPSSSQPNVWCLQSDLPCPSNATHDSVFINCGGGRVSFEGNEYEENTNDGRLAAHFESNDRWAFSSTGIYIYNDKGKFVATNDTPMSRAGAPFYETARVCPSSLKYYGLCMRGGSYKVRLHFAEIMFSDTSNFSSLGRRIFDVAIQGKVVLTDYNIAEKAKGVRRGIVEEFDVNVNGSTLEIHLYWTGKGTTAIPDRGVYGPLISAIAVTPNYKVSTGGLSTGAIVGIIVSSIFVVLLILFVLWWRGCFGKTEFEDSDLKGLDLQTGSFTLRQIRAATNNFDPANKIGEGGFGPVYKGVLLDGTIIAVKQLCSKSNQGNREFVNEIGMISALQHPHLVKLYGCCIEGNQLLLVYEYLENNNLARALFGPEQYQLHLDWPTRHKICIGIARGLTYLHEESRLKIVHRDIKATNVLLDKNLVPKISDFGLAKLDEDDNTHISTRIAGTFGYMAPEYAMRGYLTDKADVYSFGVVLLEIVSGRSNISIRPKAESFYLLDWANSLSARGNLLELVDPRLELNLHKQEITRAINVALICTNVTAAERPSMSSVVSILEGKHGVPKLVSDSIVSMDKTNVDEIEMGEGDGDGEGQDNSMDAPWSGSSTSAVDLYPINPDTKYWEKRSLSGNSY